MADNNIIRIVTSLATASAQAADYSTLLIVDTNHNSLTRLVQYTNSNYTTVAAGTPLRKALTSAFSATVKPPLVLAGRSKGTTTVTPTGVADGQLYEFSIEVADGATVTASYTAGAAEDEQDVVTGLKADIDLVTGVTDHVTATVVGTGADAVLEISLVASEDDYRVYGETANIDFSFTTTEAAADSLAAIIEQGRGFTHVISTDHTPAYVASMFAACNVLRKPFFTSSSLIENINTNYDGETAPAANDIAGVLAHNNYLYGHVMYHERASDYPEAVRVTQFTWLEPGTSDWQYKSLPGFGVAQHPTEGRPLNDTELVNLESKTASTILNEGGLSVISGRTGSGNRVGTGDRIEHVAWGLYAESKLTQRLRTLKFRKHKLGMNDSDINLVKGTMESWLNTQISQPGQAKAINPKAKWVIEFPKAKDLSFESQSSGLLESISVTVYMDASIDAIHAVPFNLTFTDVAEV